MPLPLNSEAQKAETDHQLELDGMMLYVEDGLQLSGFNPCFIWGLLTRKKNVRTPAVEAKECNWNSFNPASEFEHNLWRNMKELTQQNEDERKEGKN